MVNTAPDTLHRQYSEALLNWKKENRNVLMLYRELISLWTYGGFSDAERAMNLGKQINDTVEKLRL